MEPREIEAREAVARVLEEYADVIGPDCMCRDGEHEGSPDGRCPNVGTTVHVGGWLLVVEYADLNPETELILNRYVTPRMQSANLSKALGHRAAERF